MNDFKYKLPNNIILKIDKVVISILFSYKQEDRIPESGGILLGKLYEELLVIEQVSVPGDGDKRGLFLFHRNKVRAQAIIDHAYKSSNGEIIYIGEWHTHKEKQPNPSWIDRLEIKRAFKKSKLNLDFIIWAIAGNDSESKELWVGYYAGDKIITCEKINN
jgi:integrative and conjugative element protein (TIGR02256 family)